MRWDKLGRIYVPSGDLWWARSHASFPTVEVIDDDIVRIYYTSLDAEQFGRGGFLDVKAANPGQVVNVSREPILDLGDLGDFDDAGANPFGIVTLGERKLMYYQGWQRLARSPYAIFTGLAVGRRGNDTRFIKYARLPVLERTPDERHIRGAPFVITDGARLRMWYVASSQWRYRGDQLYYSISVRHGISTDGIVWQTEPCRGLDPDPEHEYAVGKPTVWKDGNTYRMWYSLRSFERPYAIGYAESHDGVAWLRKDGEAGIARSSDGWDSEMICYPYVVAIRDRVFMFYNGNSHGESGFGYAELR